MRLVDAGEALSELTRLSAEIERAAVLDESGAVLASTPGADDGRLARAAAEMLDIAAPVRPGEPVERVEVELPTRAVFVVRAGGLVAVATTRAEPAAALVVHDLRTCLAHVDSSRRVEGARRQKGNPVDA